MGQRAGERVGCCGDQKDNRGCSFWNTLNNKYTHFYFNKITLYFKNSFSQTKTIKTLLHTRNPAPHILIPSLSLSLAYKKFKSPHVNILFDEILKNNEQTDTGVDQYLIENGGYIYCQHLLLLLYLKNLLQMDVEKPHIDQNALSRQLAVYGHEAQGKLMALRVFIHGISGLGVEVAKNLILAGPKQVTIYDPRKVTAEDIGRNFYCREEHIGKVSRAQASLDQLKDLNPNVHVAVAHEHSVEYISNHFECVVVLDNYDHHYLVQLNKAFHQKNLGFIYAGNLGLYGFAFVDFGDHHRIFDATGEECKTVHIAGITQEERGLVCLHQEKRHNLNDGDTVSFREVKGMTEINGKEFKVEIKSPHSFLIGDTRGFSSYETGGIANEIKVPTEIKSFDLEKSLRYPYPPESKEMPIASWEKFGVPEQLHIILNSLLAFHTKHHRIPRALNADDANELKALVKQYLGGKMEIEGEDFKVASVDDKLVENVALYAETQISPCSSFWGGIITQEVVKLTGKYTPLRQWLHHEFFEVLPEGEVARSITNDRYYDYHVLFGDQFVRKAAKSSSFLIGAGALGCEFIKMFALMGFSTQGGKVMVTDDDNIEISNLNRQFLFRKKHVGKNKSETACGVGRVINHSSNFQSIKLRVSPENESIFNDNFWTGLDFVVNAVDNVKARQYVDGQCVWFEKPLFQSGTLGTKCHAQIIIPHVTISYTDIQDPPEQSIPLCTLKNFPYQIEHTIQWARDYFEGTFAEPSGDLSSFYQDRQSFLAELKKQNKQNPTTLRIKLETLNKLYLANAKRNYQVCVELAVSIFQDVFNYQIRQLLAAFPPDHIIEDTGKLFWSGLKRVPNALDLNLKDPLHVELVQSAANIFASMFNLPLERNSAHVAELASKVPLAPFVPKSNVKIQVDEKKGEKKEEPVEFNDEDEREIEKLQKELRGYNINPAEKTAIVEFQKDDPTNFHIEFMGGVSNLRARNYQIEQVDNFKVKLIAGKIIPAIATTTAMVVGAVGIEIIKFILGKKTAYKNLTCNLALPLWVFNDPIEAIVNTDKQFDPIMCGPIKVIPGKFTKWEKINVKGPLSLKDLKEHFQNTYSIEVSMITYGTATVYSSFDKRAQERLPLKVPEAIQAITKKELPKYKRFLALGVSGSTKEGVDCLLPDVRYEM